MNITGNTSDEYVCITTGGKFSQEVNYFMVVINIIVMVLILSINSILISAIRKEKCTRIDKYFLILSATDLCVGLFSLPANIVLFACFTEETICSIAPFLAPCLISPYLFSWVMTIIMTIDRCVLVIQPNFHSGFCKPTLKYFIPFCLFCCVAIGATFSVHDYFSEKKLIKESEVINYQYKAPITATIITAGELILTTAVAVSQIYLIIRVRRSMARMDSNRHTSVDNNRKVTDTIAMMFFCSTICNTPHLVTYALSNFINHGSRTILMLRLTKLVIITLYLNSLFNAVIILVRSSKLRKRALRLCN